MLEILYDANLIKLDVMNPTFRFFGARVNENYNWSWESFHKIHPMADGQTWVEWGPCIGHIHPSPKRGYCCEAVQGSLEFIVPIVGEVSKYIGKLRKADGLYVQGKFFKTADVMTTGKCLHIETGRFHVSPDHFYFLGIYVP